MPTWASLPICQMVMEGDEMKLPFDYEPCDNHKARLMAEQIISNGNANNYDAAYEVAWDRIEEERYWDIEEENE